MTQLSFSDLRLDSVSDQRKTTELNCILVPPWAPPCGLTFETPERPVTLLDLPPYSDIIGHLNTYPISVLLVNFEYGTRAMVIWKLRARYLTPVVSDNHSCFMLLLPD